MGSYVRAARIPSLSDSFVYLSCIENNYNVWEVLSRESSRALVRDGNSAELPELIWVTRPRLASVDLGQTGPWHAYLSRLSEQVPLPPRPEPVDPILRRVLERGRRYEQFLRVLCSHKKVGTPFYDRIVVDHPTESIPPDCRDVAIKGNNAVLAGEEGREHEVKQVDLSGIRAGKVCILIEEELTPGTHAKYFDKIRNWRTLRLKDDQRFPLEDTVLFIVETNARLRITSLPGGVKTVILCQREEFGRLYGEHVAGP